jgi:4-amino-4-deoxy-L-arabinose transferase-like glycosyltransferase
VSICSDIAVHSFGIINALTAMRHRFLLAGAFLYLMAANLVWIARDTRPPFWDMAAHQSTSLRIYDAFSQNWIGAITAIPLLSAPYPPFYHSIVAIFYGLFGKSIDAAQWANVPAIALLFLCTYGLGRTLLSPIAAAGAAVLVNFFPILLWLSRETLIDYWLTSIVALAMWLLIRSKEFSSRRYSVGFGIACGFGVLTKWTFPVFVGLPALWVARRNPKNAGIAAALAAAIAAYWYIPAAHSLAVLFRINAAGGISEGDPSLWSFGALVFYFRALEGYQLFLPLFIAFVVGAILLALRFDRQWLPIVLWIIGGWLGLMMVQNKDPRYTAPLLPAVALITAQIFQRKEILIVAFIPLLLFQHYLISFGIPRLPETIVLARGVEGPLSWDWNVYSQNYFRLWGAPAREDWQIQHVLDSVSRGPDPVRLGIVPDIPRFDSQAFEFYIALDKRPVTLNRLRVFDAAFIGNNDYILVSETDQGWAPNFSRDLSQINKYIRDSGAFRMIESFPLPNGDIIRLYKVASS